MKKLIAGLAMAGTLLLGACSNADQGALVQNPEVVPASANPNLLKADAAFRSTSVEQQEAFCLLIAVKGEYNTAFFAYYDDNANPRNPSVTFSETVALINSLAHYHCAVRNQDIDVSTELEDLV